MPRLILIEESIESPLAALANSPEAKRFTATLEDGQKITVVEYPVSDDGVLELIHAVAGALKPERFYAHVWRDASRLCVAFPSCVVDLTKNDDVAIEMALHIGARCGIPQAEMRFAEMFDTDHPDLGGAGVES